MEDQKTNIYSLRKINKNVLDKGYNSKPYKAKFETYVPAFPAYGVKPTTVYNPGDTPEKLTACAIPDASSYQSNNLNWCDNNSYILKYRWWKSKDNKDWQLIEGTEQIYDTRKDPVGGRDPELDPNHSRVASYQPPAIEASETGRIYYRCGVVVESVFGRFREDGTYDPNDHFQSEEAFSVATFIIRGAGTVEWSGGSGTITAPYILDNSNVETLLKQLERLRDDVNDGMSYAGVYFKLKTAGGKTSLTLPEGWVPIGEYYAKADPDKGKDKGMRPFSGIIDFRTATVIVPEGGQPLFGLCREATIEGLRVKGTDIDGPGFVKTYKIDYGPDGVYATVDDPKYTVKFINCKLLKGSKTRQSGFIHGAASGINNVIFYNCEVQSEVTIGQEGKDPGPIGSFCGQLSGIISNCKSAATVYGNNNVGGLSGSKNQSMGTCLIVNSSFTGTVKAAGNYAGGIIGQGYNNTSGPNTPCVSIQNCLVTGSVTGADCVGGIFGGEGGSKQCWANGIGYIQNNLFTGTLAANGTYKGGIIGYMRSLDRYNVISNNYYKEGTADRGIGFVASIDTSARTPGTYGGTEYTNTASSDHSYNRSDDPLGNTEYAKKLTALAEGVDDKTWGNPMLEKLNGGMNSIKSWAMVSNTLGFDADIANAEPYPCVFMKVEAARKGQYAGEAFDPGNITLTLTDIKGNTTTKTLKPEEVKFGDGDIDMEKPGIYGVEVTYEHTYLYKGQTTKDVPQTLQAFLEYGVYEKDEGSAKNVTVSFSLLGDNRHDAAEEGVGSHTLADGNLMTWLEDKKYTLPPRSTVWDLLQAAAEDGALAYDNPSGNYVKSITWNGITLGEFTNGSNSGWMYTINGVHSDNGVSQQHLKDGDVVVFHYTDDYTKEKDTDEALQKGANAVIELIRAIPTPVTLKCQDAIKAAREAYDNLPTARQKTMVSNYADLVKAEKALAELLADAADHEAAAAVEALIGAIGTPVTSGSREAIEKARAAYDALTDLRKLLVKNYDDLVAAEEAYRKLPDGFRSIHQAVGDYLLTLGTPTVNSIGGEWMVIGLARAGRLSDALGSGYYNNLEKFVKENINDKEQLDKNKSTENARVILALSAMGRDATNVAGHNLLAGFTDIGYVKRQGINGPIWALIALDSRNYDAPSESVTREKLIQEILKGQLDDGGWALSGTKADPDMTGMALQALAPYYKGGRSEGKSGTDSNELNIAVERALERLSQLQGNDGGYGSAVSGTATNSESCVQVIVALTALKIDPAKDGRFAKDGKTVIDALLGFYVKGGGFEHTSGGGTDGMATEQGYYALTAYLRYLDGKSSLYDMNDVGAKKVYRIMEGTDDLWSVNEDGSVSIRADGAVADFRDLMVDGKLVDPSNYTVTSGSTIVTLKPEFLKSLGEGNHEITFVYVDGAVTMTLPLGAGGTPIRKSDAPGGPTAPGKPLNSVGTGDQSSIAFYAAMLLLSAACASAVIYRKRRNERAGK